MAMGLPTKGECSIVGVLICFKWDNPLSRQWMAVMFGWKWRRVFQEPSTQDKQGNHRSSDIYEVKVEA